MADDSEVTNSLRIRWEALAGPSAAARDTGEDLLARYREAHRRYHTERHLAAVLDVVDELACCADNLDAVRYAAFFHDAVYVIGRDDNEERSAELAGHALDRLGVATSTVAEAIRLVRLTADHAPAPGDRDGAVLCDADLAILGSAPERYAAYATAVRQEYRQVPEELFCAGRAAVLLSLLALPELFRTPAARERFTDQALRNLTAELARLEGGSGTMP